MNLNLLYWIENLQCAAHNSRYWANPKDKMVGLSNNEVCVRAASTASQWEICVFFSGKHSGCKQMVPLLGLSFLPVYQVDSPF